MKMAHVIRLDPTVEQSIALGRAAGVSRFTYNWALAEYKRLYKAGEKPKLFVMKKRFNALKRVQFPWMMESPRDANSQPFADLQKAFNAFFRSASGARPGPKVGYPTFHKRGDNDAFYVANDQFRFDADGRHVVLPVIGRVKIDEALRFAGKILNGRVRRTAGRWTLSVQVEGHFEVPNTPHRPIVGVDLGLTTAVVTSAGETFDAPKPLKKALARLRRSNRTLHRRVKGGKNRAKARDVVAKNHARIANVRADFMHKVTTRLARENQAVVIEDLNVRGMLKNRGLARSIVDVGFGMFRRLMKYKGVRFGCDVIVASRWFPSSKRCSGCGAVRETLDLGERVYRCASCGLVLDRDLNAALNLERYPGLPGNPSRDETPMDTRAAARRVKARRVSPVVEVGTEQ